MGHYITAVCTAEIINGGATYWDVCCWVKQVFWKMTHPTTAGYSLKSMMWGTDGTERRGCGERCSEVFQHGNKDFDCLSMNNSSLLIAVYDKETVLGPVQNVSGQMEAKRNSKQTGNFCSPPPQGERNTIVWKPHRSVCNRNWVIDINIKLIPSVWLLHSLAARVKERGSDEVNTFVLPLKPDKCQSLTTAALRWFPELRCTARTLYWFHRSEPKFLGMWISCMPAEMYLRVYMWAFTCMHSYTHPLLLQLLSSHSLSLCLTSHDPLWFHLSWFSTLHFLLKTWFSQSSPVSHPSSSSSVSPPTYLLTPSNPLPRCYSTIWPRWCCLRAHITVPSSLNWNLKRGAFNMVLPGGILPSTPALLHGAVSRAPLAGLPLWKATGEPGKSHKSMNKGSVTLWNTWSWRLDGPLFMGSFF